MNGIPEDVRRAAENVYTDLPNDHDWAWDEKAVEIIARALLAERERCARIAEDRTRKIGRGDFGLVGPVGVGCVIAAAIRGQQP